MKLAGCLLFSVFYLLVPRVFAQDSNGSSSDSGVLVSSPTHAQVSDQDNTGNNGGSDAPSGSSQNTTENNSNGGGTSNSPTDEIVLKSTNAVMAQITANMKLTQDQISAIQPIILDNIEKVRNLQLSLQKGDIDGKTMYNQRESLTESENQALGRIFNSDQMKVWMNIQSQ